MRWLPSGKVHVPLHSLAFQGGILLDAMTVYGTQLLQPFTDHPFAVGSMFIIDPLYTLPLLVGVSLGFRFFGARLRSGWLGALVKLTCDTGSKALNRPG